MIISLAFMKTSHSGTVVNIGSGKGVILQEFILSIARILRGDSLMRFGELEYRTREMESLVADVSRLHLLLGNSCPETPIAEGVERMVTALTAKESRP
jgi:nucleoside-diphosphate-sugar epimerase